MLTGGIALQQELQVPAALIVALNGIVVLFVVASLKLKTRLRAWAEAVGSEGSDGTASPPPEPVPGTAVSAAASESSDG